MNGLYPGRRRSRAGTWPAGIRRPRCRDPGGAEVRRAGEVHHARAERVLACGVGLVERHGLHRGRVADRDVGELGRVVHAQVVRQPGVGGVQQHVPHCLAVRGARVQRQPHRLLAEVDLDRAFLGQVSSGAAGPTSGPRPPAVGPMAWRSPRGRHGGEHRRSGDRTAAAAASHHRRFKIFICCPPLPAGPRSRTYLFPNIPVSLGLV